MQTALSAAARHHTMLSEFFFIFILLSYTVLQHTYQSHKCTIGYIYSTNDKGSFQRSPKLSTGLYLTPKHCTCSLVWLYRGYDSIRATQTATVAISATVSVFATEFDMFFHDKRATLELRDTGKSWLLYREHTQTHTGLYAACRYVTHLQYVKASLASDAVLRNVPTPKNCCRARSVWVLIWTL